VIALAHIVFQFLADLLGLAALSFRPRPSVEAENLFLRRQLALYKERSIKPRRLDAATRMSLVFLSKLFDWRDALIIVRPETLIRLASSWVAITVALEVSAGTPGDSAGVAPVDSAHGNGESVVG
jgi:hypothetical protein